MTILIALGANLPSRVGSPAETVAATLHRLRHYDLTVTLQSAIYETPAVPSGSGPAFANAVAAVKTDVEPIGVLSRLHEIENAMDRERGGRWTARTLDLDLLAYRDIVAPDRATVTEWIGLPPGAQMTRTPQELLLPHPRLHQRAFVLVPLTEIAPDWRHPLLGRTAREMRDALPPEEVAQITPL
ncbi:MAG: 2-amino-4-hydroxy-6-hydroxymethyldihydropteridine diphosphokinase [Shimia sp.]